MMNSKIEIPQKMKFSLKKSESEGIMKTVLNLCKIWNEIWKSSIFGPVVSLLVKKDIELDIGLNFGRKTKKWF